MPGYTKLCYRTVMQPPDIKKLSANSVLGQFLQATVLYVGKNTPALLLKSLCANHCLDSVLLDIQAPNMKEVRHLSIANASAVQQ